MQTRVNIPFWPAVTFRNKLIFKICELGLFVCVLVYVSEQCLAMASEQNVGHVSVRQHMAPRKPPPPPGGLGVLWVRCRTNSCSLRRWRWCWWWSCGGALCGAVVRFWVCVCVCLFVSSISLLWLEGERGPSVMVVVLSTHHRLWAMVVFVF